MERHLPGRPGHQPHLQPSGAIAAKPGQFYDNETDNYQQDHYQLFFNQALRSDMNFNVALHYTRGRGYYENYRNGESWCRLPAWNRPS